MEGDYILLWCLVCKDATPHTITNPQCITCKRNFETTPDRFRRFEGQTDRRDPFDYKELGENKNPGME